MKVILLFLLSGLCAAQSDGVSTLEVDIKIEGEPVANQTTTAAAANSTAAPTTAAPTTAAPTTVAPVSDAFYSVKAEDGKTNCIMFDGDFKLNIDYFVNGKKKSADVTLPAPSVSSTANGTCGGAGELAVITVHWEQVNEFSLKFNTSAADKYELVGVQMKVQLTKAKFNGSADAGKVLDVSGQLPGLSFVPISLNHSLACRSNVESTNFTASVFGSNETYVVSANALGFHLQAFNVKETAGKFGEGEKCSNDLTSDLVPIAVGVALAALVFLVLVSYLIGRRRRASAYESV